MVKKNLNSHKVAFFLLRIALGWIFFYSGVSKIIDPSWSAEKFLLASKSFPGFFSWFASAENIGWVNALNVWGQAFIGLSLITGTFVRISSVFGIAMTLLYYFPRLNFPFTETGFLIDEHIIYILVFAIFICERAGTIWGLDYFINKKAKNWLV